MKRRAKRVGIGIIATVAVAALVSCNKLEGGPGTPGTKGPPAGAKSCPGAACTITVTIVDGKCVPDNNHVVLGSDTVVTWHFQGPAGYKFKANGVEFTTPGWQSTFKGGTGGGTQDFEWAVKHVTPAGKEYEYKIHIDSGGQPACTVDPSLWV